MNTFLRRLARTTGVLTLLAAVPLAESVVTGASTGFGWS